MRKKGGTWEFKEEVKDYPFQPVIVNDIFMQCLDDTSRYQLLWGGGSSGKSDFKALHLLEKAQKNEYFRGLYSRKFERDIRISQYLLFEDVCKRYNWMDRFRFYKNTMEIVCTLNDNKFIAAGLDNVDRLKSIADITDVWLEEPIGKRPNDDIQLSDVTELDRRLRTARAPVQFHMTFNPINKENFIYEQFFKEQNFQPLLAVKSNYLHNRFCPEHDRLKYEALKRISLYEYQVYALGDWGNPRTGKEWIYNFDPQVHVEPCPLTPRKAIHVSFDFNIRPYLTMLVFQVEHDDKIYTVRQVGEHCLVHPNNSTRAACKILKDYYADQFDCPIYLYGDPDGKKGRTGIKSSIAGYESDDARPFDEIKHHLSGYLDEYADRVRTNYPSRAVARDFMNGIFANRYNVRYYIDPSCVNTINDFQVIQEGVDGYVKAKGVEDGVKFEKVGHCYDANVYFATMFFDWIYDEPDIVWLG